MFTLNLEKKKILITGGSSGIGKRIALACAEEGAQVVIVGTNEVRLKETIMQMKGGPHFYKIINLNADNNFDLLFKEIVSEIGKLDGMVYSAGISGVIPIKAITKEKMLEIMSVNYFSFIEMIKEYSKKKYSNGGSVVGISSAVTERGELCQTIYAASKAAMEISAKCLAIELAAKNIRVNTILPGMIETEMMDKVLEMGSKREELGAKSVLGIGKTEDIANTCLFLLSDVSSHITGRGMYVDGGCFL